MLKYKCVPSPTGLSVRFERPTSWISPIATALFLFVGREFALAIDRLGNSSKLSILATIMAMTTAFISILVLYALIFILATDLRSYRCVFSREGITLISTYFGMSTKVQDFYISEIHRFGYGHVGHMRSGVLQFAASGSYFRLAWGVDEQDAIEFTMFLRQKGFEYSSLDEPEHRRTAASTLLG